MSGFRLGVRAAESGLVPDALIRRAIRRLCRDALSEAWGPPGSSFRERALDAFVEEMARAPIAPKPESANEQHYELPPEFFREVLGPRLKYSSAFWPEGTSSLAEAEEAALAVTCERAGVGDGAKVLELGCGWGSLTLWLAERYPAARITAVSNSAPQRRHIEARAAERQLRNLRVVTADMNRFETPERFDRVLSVEMFEHMRNWDSLLRRIASWLKPDGRLFLHYFCHRSFAYRYDADDPRDWIGRWFFTEGIMPSADLVGRFRSGLVVTGEWDWSGTHYQRTAEAWLQNLDAQRDGVLEILVRHYGSREAARWLHRWRIFFLACAELFGYEGGDEWLVAHRLLARE